MIESVEKSLVMTRELLTGAIDKKESDYQLYDWLYLFATENLKKSYQALDLIDKKILTVASSGDHSLEAVSSGAKSITSFDINYLCKFYQDLKIGAVLALSFTEFCRFFYYDNRFSIKLYQKTREYLPLDSEQYWTTLFSTYNSKLIDEKLFVIKSMVNKNNLDKMISYFNEENYNILKQKLKNFPKIPFIHSNITELPANLNDKYDVMILSNISNFLPFIYGIKDLASIECLYKFRELIIELEKFLTAGGVIVLGYLYDVDYNNQVTAFENKMAREIVFGCQNLINYEFSDGFKYKDSSDEIVLYRKNNFI